MVVPSLYESTASYGMLLGDRKLKSREISKRLLADHGRGQIQVPVSASFNLFAEISSVRR